ncbi:MAG: hypothetical protein K2I71_05450 [Helicobacter sp.]|nr:hypothetical protein [Helicobacter sp.]
MKNNLATKVAINISNSIILKLPKNSFCGDLLMKKVFFISTLKFVYLDNLNAQKEV